ncbi:MAG: uroporphyrinogen decarboxylase [Lachnospiraceae bacterium]|nr:uroporphyrinogen decarboxylase [Lachnospiraceae bacterium]
MLTAKENLREVMKKDGHPDRFVNQYDFLHVLVPDLYYMGGYPLEPGKEGYDQFGVLWRFPEGQMGAFPVHDDEHRVLKDITEWREIVHKPFIPDDPGYWGMLNGFAAQADRENQYICALQTQGIFERLHALMGMEDAMANFYMEPEEMHELIDFLVEIELDFARVMIEKVGIEAVLHHDDWGSLKTSFMSPQMFDEFITPAYKKIYGYYHDHNVLVVHHNDAYSANLVPSMIEMGIDIWQGATPTNNIPELIEKYGGQITFMGEIETKVCDLPTWTPEIIAAEVERACRKCGIHSFIPCQTAGMSGSAFPGVYEEIRKQIDRMSKEMF